MQQKTFRSKDMRRARTFATALLVTGLWLSGLPPTHADETCMSPYMAKITGQEDVVYVWTLGAEGVGDGSDKLVTVDVRPTSPTYGKVVHTASVGGRHEAHHAGFTDDRRYLWAGGLVQRFVSPCQVKPPVAGKAVAHRIVVRTAWDAG
jgi:selenium-binding protein 1